MSSTDWTVATGSSGTGNIRRGPTDAPPYGVPNGGGTFAHGFGSAVSTQEVVALFHNGSGFSPTAKGGRVVGAMCRAGKGSDGGNNDLYCPLMFVNAQGVNISDEAYILGMTEEEPSRIILAKQALNLGLSPTTAGMIRLSTATFAKGTWVDLRLDVIEQPAGDVLLRVFQNADLATNPVTARVWTAIAGMADFSDDKLGHATGSVPFTGGGRIGFGFFSRAASNRYAYFDQVTAHKDNT